MISNIDNVASNFADTEQSILIISVACATTLPPVKSSNDDPAGIDTSLTNKTVSFVSVSDVSDTNWTEAVTPVVWILQSVSPITTQVVEFGTV